MRAAYPNLELIEYVFRQNLLQDEIWTAKLEKIREKNKYVHAEFDIQVFSQVWGNTCTAFDVMPDGSPAIGGCAMTSAYTVVIRECTTDTYGVFVDGKPCYVVFDASEVFYVDLKNRNMASLSRAKREY